MCERERERARERERDGFIGYTKGTTWLLVTLFRPPLIPHAIIDDSFTKLNNV